MKIISFENGRVTWLFPVEEFLPLQFAKGAQVLAAVAEKYSFQHPPKNPTQETIKEAGIRFEQGRFTTDASDIFVSDLTLFNDGIVANSHTTEGADLFLIDLYRFLVDHHEFRSVVSPIRKINNSTLVVEFEESLDALLPAQSAALTAVTKALNAVEQTNFPGEVVRIDFALNKDPDPRPLTMPKLSIERRALSLSNQNRYFSTGPISTSEHAEILGNIEKNLLWKRR